MCDSRDKATIDNKGLLDQSVRSAFIGSIEAARRAGNSDATNASTNKNPAAAASTGIDVAGPFGADTMFHNKGVDAFIVMLHDQGHITAKLMAPNATAGLAIGSPILFSSVAHGSAHDIAGKGVASPIAMIEAITRLAKARVSRSRAAASTTAPAAAE